MLQPSTRTTRCVIRVRVRGFQRRARKRDSIPERGDIMWRAVYWDVSETCQKKREELGLGLGLWVSNGRGGRKARGRGGRAMIGQ